MARTRGMGSRRNAGLLELALHRNWPIAAALAVTMALGGMMILPSLLGSSPTLAQLTVRLKPVVWSVCGFFALVAIIKCRLAMRAESRQRMHEYLAREAAVRSVARFPRNAHFRAESLQATPLHAAMQTRAIRPSSLMLGLATPTGKPTSWSLELIQSIEWKRFEELCAEFYREQNIPCATTPLGPDGGIDIRLFRNEEGPVGTYRYPTAIIQCKARGARLIGVKPVRDLLGVMTDENIPEAFIMTSGSFTDGAHAVANGNNITLLDGKTILAMIARMPDESSQRLLAFATAGDYRTPSCPRCAVKMILREGDEGGLWRCIAYPKCRQSLPMQK